MRASRLAIMGLIGAAGAFAARRGGIAGRLRAQLEGDGQQRASETGADRDVWPTTGGPLTVDSDRVLDEREAQADAMRDVDPSADFGDLVQAERDVLTVEGEEGEDHRRRDQSPEAAEGAQQIAAAHVRARRYGSDLENEDAE